MRGRGGRGEDDIRLHSHKLCDQSCEPVGTPIGVAPLDHDILSFGIPEVLQSLLECGLEGANRCCVSQVKHSQAMDLLWSLSDGGGHRHQHHDDGGQDGTEKGGTHALIGS